MILTAVASLLLSSLTLVSAAPAQKSYGCDVKDALLDLPPTNILNIPSDAKPEFIALGVGTQVCSLSFQLNLVSCILTDTLFSLFARYQECIVAHPDDARSGVSRPAIKKVRHRSLARTHTCSSNIRC